jgi:hypothetical protein
MAENENWKPTGYVSFAQRDTHHWDVSDGRYGRAFRIRGEPGNVMVADERQDSARAFPRDWLVFKSLHAALLFIFDEMMPEVRS